MVKSRQETESAKCKGGCGSQTLFFTNWVKFHFRLSRQQSASSNSDLEGLWCSAFLLHIFGFVYLYFSVAYGDGLNSLFSFPWLLGLIPLIDTDTNPLSLMLMQNWRGRQRKIRFPKFYHWFDWINWYLFDLFNQLFIASLSSQRLPLSSGQGASSWWSSWQIRCWTQPSAPVIPVDTQGEGGLIFFSEI